MTWTEIIEKLEIPGPMIRTFIAPLKAGFSGGTLVISLKDPGTEGARHILKHVDAFYAPKIEALAKGKVKVEGI